MAKRSWTFPGHASPESDLILSLKHPPWSWALLALAGAAACTPTPREPSTFLPPAELAEVQKINPPVVKPYDPEIPDASPTTPVESSTLPPVRKR
jgi:hypothetical protein